MLIRHADPDRDAVQCAAIYSKFVLDSAISFEDEPPSEADMASRIAETSSRYPWLVAEVDGVVAGYAYASAHRQRAAYRWAADVAVYVSEAVQRRGVGRALYEALLKLLRLQGVRVACAGVALPNEASVGLHEALGFEPVGVYRRIGWKAGAWQDVGWWQLELMPPSDRPPAEVGAPVRLGGSD